jgi:tetratricopeptide (TPR) repeat protein
MRAPAATLLLLLLVLATPARAQLGLDLGAPPAQPDKAEPARKVEPQKPAPKKTEPKKPEPRKAEPRKPDAKKAEPRKAEPRKSEPPPAEVRPPEPRPPEPAVKPSEPRQAAPARAEPAGPAPGLAVAGEAKARLEAARKLAEQKKFEASALAFDAILRDPGLFETHDEARYQLAKTLSLAGLHHAALSYFDEILERGPSRTRYFHNALEWLFRGSRSTASEQEVLPRVARYAREGAPPEFQDRFHFLLAKYEFERGRALEEAGKGEEARGSWREASRLAGLVRREAGASATQVVGAEDDGDIYGRAQFIDGLARFALGDEQAASEKFKEVVRLTNPRKGRAGDVELRELAFLQLARLHYQNRQNRYAVFYYGKMPWGGSQWLEGLWEASYAHYRIGEHEKALGNLLTLQSAYFKDEYFPESWVLKAIVYYENCRYPEARRVLEGFNAIYEPLYDELVALGGKKSAPAAFLDQVASPRVRSVAFTDASIKRLAEAAAEIDAEVDRGIGGRGKEFRGSLLATTLKERLAREKTQLLTEAGLRARAKLELERDQLRSILAQALRISIEVSRQEREALEGSLAAGRQVEVVKDLRWTHAVSDEHLYWPYEGEFWRDELGTYSYTLTKGCKDRPPRPPGR